MSIIMDERHVMWRILFAAVRNYKIIKVTNYVWNTLESDTFDRFSSKFSAKDTALDSSQGQDRVSAPRSAPRQALIEGGENVAQYLTLAQVLTRRQYRELTQISDFSVKQYNQDNDSIRSQGLENQYLVYLLQI